MAKVVNRFKNLLAQVEYETDKRPTYEEISEETGIAMSTLSSWSKGNIKRFDADTITLLVDFFNRRLQDGCRLGDLLEYPPANGQGIHSRQDDPEMVPA